MSDEKDNSSTAWTEAEREYAYHEVIDSSIEEIKKADPDFYAKLQNDPRFKKLQRATGQERSDLVRWFLDEVRPRQQSGPLASIRRLFSGK